MEMTVIRALVDALQNDASCRCLGQIRREPHDLVLGYLLSNAEFPLGSEVAYEISGRGRESATAMVGLTRTPSTPRAFAIPCPTNRFGVAVSIPSSRIEALPSLGLIARCASLRLVWDGVALSRFCSCLCGIRFERTAWPIVRGDPASAGLATGENSLLRGAASGDGLRSIIDGPHQEAKEQARVLVEASTALVNQEFENLPSGYACRPGVSSLRVSELPTKPRRRRCR